MNNSNSRGAPRPMGGNGTTEDKCAEIGCREAPTHTYLSPTARKKGWAPLGLCDAHIEGVRKMESFMRANGYPGIDYEIRPLEVA